MINRRHFLQYASGLALLSTGVISSEANAGVISVPSDSRDFWKAPRELWLGRSATGEQVKLTYWKDGQYDPNGYAMACHMLRDVQAGVTKQMSPKLLDLLRAIQGWLVYYNVNEPILVTSGLRIERTNRNTEGAARDSRHIHGGASDIRIPGLPSEYIGRLAASMRVGGVGFYNDKKFTHVDDGRIRYWRG